MLTTAKTVKGGGKGITLAARAVILGLILACEKIPLDLLVNVDAAQSSAGLGAVVLVTQHLVFRFSVAVVLSLWLFSFAKGDRAAWVAIGNSVRTERVRKTWCVIHALAVLPLVPLSYFLYGRSDAPFSFPALVGLWMSFALLAVGALATALAPWNIWWRAIRRPGILWLYSALIAAIATGTIRVSQHLWASTTVVTFEIVKHVLQPILPGMHADPVMQILSTNRFAVQITEYCSGLEGAGMVFAFTGAWLLCFREQYRFPRALILIPLGIALSFGLNVLRIALLMLIGDSGYPGTAIFGFHSQAGWIAFILEAGLIATTSLRSRWIARSPREASFEGPKRLLPSADGVCGDAENPTAIYLLPLLALLGAGIISQVFSSGFETLYFIRLIAGASALAWAWRWLRGLDWRYSWRGAMAGVGSFGVWAVVSPLMTHAQSMPAGLAAMSEQARVLWISIWAVGAVLIVPIAEELAFRGYLMRRLVSANFDRVSFGYVGLAALLISSLVFGIEHGNLWLPASLVGVIYGQLVIKTGRIGEGVLAHATAAALLIIFVLIKGQWQLL